MEKRLLGGCPFVGVGLWFFFFSGDGRGRMVRWIGVGDWWMDVQYDEC